MCSPLIISNDHCDDVNDHQEIFVILMYRLDSADGARPEPPLLNFEASKNFGFVRSSQVRWRGDWGVE